MFDETYYKNKKEKVIQKVQVSKNKVIQKMIDLLNEFLAEQRELQEQINEIDAILKENASKKDKKQVGGDKKTG